MDKITLVPETDNTQTIADCMAHYYTRALEVTRANGDVEIWVLVEPTHCPMVAADKMEKQS